MKTEDYVSYEQAMMLKDKGFNWPCYNFWSLEPDGKPCIITSTLCNVCNSDLKGRDVTAPFLSQAQKWLREEKGYHINVWICACGYGWEICKCSTPENMGTSVLQFDEESGDDKPSGMWTKYELALSDAITKAIKLI